MNGKDLGFATFSWWIVIQDRWSLESGVAQDEGKHLITLSWLTQPNYVTTVKLLYLML